MMSENKISRFLGLLNLETKKRNATWEVISPTAVSSLDAEQDLSGKVYFTTYKNKILRLYKYSQPFQVDEFEFVKRTYFKLEFIDEQNLNVWTFPPIYRELEDLYSTVQVATSGIDNYFDDVLSDDV